MGEKKLLTPLHVSVLFPRRVKDKQKDKQFSKFIEMFKKLHVNIPFTETIVEMSKYAKFLKEIISNKEIGRLYNS